MLALKAIVVSLQNRTLLYFPATYRAHFYQRVIRLGAGSYRPTTSLRKNLPLRKDVRLRT